MCSRVCETRNTMDLRDATPGIYDREMEIMQKSVTTFIDTLFINFLDISKPQIYLISKGINKF